MTEPATTSKEHQFVAYFDSLGFECIVDVTSYERKKLLATIKGDGDKLKPFNMHHLMMRARFNPQRNPEIYLFTSDVDQATLWQLAEEDPQAMADLIRKHGHCIWKTKSQEGVIK
jgi:hypothetical protein